MPVTINGNGSITGLSVGTGTIRSIDGAIINATATSLTLHIENMTGTVSIKYYENNTLVATVANQTVTSSFTIVTAVPAAVYGQTVGDTIAVEVVDSSGGVSGNRIFLTVSSLPSGGTVTTSGSDRIHTFSGTGRNTGSGVFVNTINNLSVQYLLVGGGGGAPGYGGSDGGGGGGGGFLTGTTKLPIGTYHIEVGKGGAGGNYNLRAAGYAHDGEHGTSPGARNGGDSKFYQFTAFGGGAGSLAGSGVGGAGDGGSGGGGTDGSKYKGHGSSINGQGNEGGTGAGSCNGKAGGGGGGAGGVGGNGTNGNGGNGGAGLASSISGSSVISAGGGGGVVYTGTSGSGGSGGGGAAKSYNAGDGVSGTDGLGGGGGAVATLNGDGGRGGNGVVILRYTP